MKNNIFDITRFGLLVRKRFTDTKSSLLYEVSGVAAVLCIIFGLMCLGSKNISGDAEGVLFVAGLIIMGLVYADRAFSDTKNRVRGMFYLSTPASRLEKLLVAILYTSILYPLAYLVIFLAVDGLFYIIVKSTGLITMESLGGITFDEKVWSLVQVLLVFQAVYMLGSIWFGKRSLLKTTVAIVVFYGLMAVIAGIIIRTNLEQLQAFGESTRGINVSLRGEDFVNGNWIRAAIWLLIPFFWTITYFRLSEKQI